MSHFTLLKNQNKKVLEDDIISGILSRDEKIIFKLYQSYYPRIKKLVYTFKNPMIDPEDIFQEGFTLTVYNIRSGKFRGESSVFTYLNKICYNLCLKQLNEKSKMNHYHPIDIEFEQMDNTVDLLNRVVELRHKLSSKCLKIIDLRFGLEDALNHYEMDSDRKLMAFEEIATVLKIDVSNARQRFKRCLDQLKAFVKSDNILQQYLED